MNILTDNSLNSIDTEIEKKDKLGFGVYAGLLSKIIKETKSEDLPFSMGIYGNWGSGKTSLMHYVKHLLEKEEPKKQKDFPKYKPAWFNPWKYDTKEEIRNDLIQCILYKIEDDNPNDELKRNITTLLRNTG